MLRKRVISFKLDLSSNPVRVLAQGVSPRGTRFGHTEVQLPPHALGTKPTLEGLELLLERLLGHDVPG